MAIQTKTSLQTTSYTSAFRVVLPGLLIGIMLLAVSFASKSAADSEQRAIERALTAGSPQPDDLRLDVRLDASPQKDAPRRQSVVSTTETALRRLNNPEDVSPLERVTFEIDLSADTTSDSSGPQIPLELLEVLSRRASALQLQLTLQVAPANRETALRWFDVIRESAEIRQIVGVSEIAICMNDGTPPDKLRIHVLRTKKMATGQEPQR